jgi:citrate synthase
MISLEQLIATTLKIPTAQVTDALAFDDIPEWDSLSHVNLMLALESAYKTSIDEDHMVELTSVKAIRQFIEDETRQRG